MKMDKNNNIYLTTTEVSDLLRITRRTVYNYIKSGVLKCSKVGRLYRVKSQDLEEFIKPKPGKKKKKAV